MCTRRTFRCAHALQIHSSSSQTDSQTDLSSLSRTRADGFAGFSHFGSIQQLDAPR